MNVNQFVPWTMVVPGWNHFWLFLILIHDVEKSAPSERETLIFLSCLSGIPKITKPEAYIHGLINYTDTKAKCRHLKKLPVKGPCDRRLSEFIERYSQSCWYFWPSFVNCCHSNLLSGWTPPPPSPYQSTEIQTVCGWEGVGGVESCWRPYSARV